MSGVSLSRLMLATEYLEIGGIPLAGFPLLFECEGEPGEATLSFADRLPGQGRSFQEQPVGLWPCSSHWMKCESNAREQATPRA
jgi:hypothetical protein